MHKTRQNATESSLWIYNPWLDLIVGCGAWSAPLLLLLVFFAGLERAHLVGCVLRAGALL